MADYRLPMALVHQELRTIPSAITEPLRACIVGPFYKLVRYDQTDEKSGGYLGVYDPDSDKSYSWPARPVGGVVDEDYTRLFIDDALLRYFHDPRDGGYTEIRAVCGYRNRIKATDASFRWKSHADWPRHPSLFERDVQAGDIVRIEGSIDGASTVQWTSVKGFSHDVVPSVVGNALADDGNQVTALADCSALQTGGPVNLVAITPDGDDYEGCPAGRVSETYTVEVIQGSVGGDATTARLRVTSADGKDNVASLRPSAFGAETLIGTRGLSATFTNVAGPDPPSSSPGVDYDDFVVGQTWSIDVTQDFAAPEAVSGGDYAGPSDTTYIVTVTRGSCDDFTTSPQITVTTTTGIDYSGPHNVTGPGVPVQIGSYGVTVEFVARQGLSYGDKYYIIVRAESPGAVRTLILENNLLPGFLVDPLVSSSPGMEICGVDLSVSLFIKKNIEVEKNRVSSPPLTNWGTSSTQILVESGIEAYDASWTLSGALLPLPVRGGSLYVNCRYLRTAECGRIGYVDDVSDAVTLAPLHPDNPLGLGVFKCAENANGTRVYYVPVCEDSLAGYLAVLEVLENTQQVWGLVPMIYLKTVQDAFRAHTLAMSTPERGRWRECFLAKALELRSPVISVKSDGTPYLGTLESDPDDPGNIVYFESSGAGFISKGVRAGDELRYHYGTDGFGAVIYSSYVVDTVVNDDALRLVAGDAVESLVAKKFEVHHPNTTGELAAQVAAYGGLFEHRRCTVVFPDNPSNAGTEMAGYFLAAAIAGLKSGVVPQQGLTNLAVAGFDDVGRTTRFFSDSELNTIAAGGILIVTQDATGTVYVRHQLTTDMTDVNHRELSITADLDACSYVFLRRIAPYIGRMNVTGRTLAKVRTEIEATVEYLKSAAETELAGAMIDDGKLIKLEQDPVLKDHVNIDIELDLPEPFNNAVIKLRA